MKPMQFTTVLSTVVLSLCFGAAQASTHKAAPDMAASGAAKAPTAQQTKMGECNKEAGEKKGEERKKFMSACLSNKKVTQQDKMKSCNQDAGDKKGEERKKFMSACLKG